MPCLPPTVHDGLWLVENMPRGYDLELPERLSSRPIPFIDSGEFERLDLRPRDVEL